LKRVEEGEEERGRESERARETREKEMKKIRTPINNE